MRKIAIEEHWAHPINEEFRAENQRKTQFPVFVDPDILVSQVMPRIAIEAFEKYRFPEMDQNEIEMQILSFCSPGIQGIIDPGEAVNKAQMINDMQAEIMKKYPKRFAGLAALPTQAPRAAANELERAVKELGFKGALINGHTYGEYLDQKEFWVLWERAEALGVPLYLHPFNPPEDQIKIYQGYTEMHGPTWAWNAETAAHAMRIVLSGIFEAFPKATLILGHMGEMIPYELGRIDEGYTTAGGYKTGRLKNKPSYYVKNNIMISTSGLWYPETMLCAIDALGADRIMFGADYPFIGPDKAVALIENTPISDEIKEKIYYSNAAKLFGLSSEPN